MLKSKNGSTTLIAIVMTIIVILILAIIGFVVYKYGESRGQESAVTEIAASENPTINTVADDAITNPEVDDNTNIVSNNTNNNTSNSQPNTIVTEVNKFVPFDSAKGKTVIENSVYEVIGDNFNDYLELNVKNGEVYIHALKQPSEFTGLMSSTDQSKIVVKYGEDVKIKGLTKKVVYAKILAEGQALGNEVAVFLMEDGTCEYAKLSSLLVNVTAQGKINGLKDIVRLEDADVSFHAGGGGVAGIAIDKDGYFYDVHKLLGY